jgi:RHS repeat-associated protein
LDNSGLYYYGARYYDPTIGRFISADTIVPRTTDPQSLNRFSYCINNPLRYRDPSGHLTFEEYYASMMQYGVVPSADATITERTFTPGPVTTFSAEGTLNAYRPQETAELEPEIATIPIIGHILAVLNIVTLVNPPPPVQIATIDYRSTVEIDYSSDVTTKVSIDVFLRGDGISLTSVSLNAERPQTTTSTNCVSVFGATLPPVKRSLVMNPSDPSGVVPMTWVGPDHYSGSVTMSNSYQALSVDLDFAYSNPYEFAWLNTPQRRIILR